MKAIVFAKKEAAPFEIGEKGSILVIQQDRLDDIKPSMCNSIECFDVLESHEDPEILKILLAKVRIGGIIKIKGTDVMQACRMRERGTLTNRQFSDLIVYGKSRSVDLNTILGYIEKTDSFDVLFAGIIGTEYFLEARRNK